MVVRHGVAVTEPFDVPVDAAESIRDPGGVVRMLGQRPQVRRLVAKPIEGGQPVTLARVDDANEPVGELRGEVVAIAK